MSEASVRSLSYRQRCSCNETRLSCFLSIISRQTNVKVQIYLYTYPYIWIYLTTLARSVHFRTNTKYFSDWYFWVEFLDGFLGGSLDNSTERNRILVSNNSKNQSTRLVLRSLTEMGTGTCSFSLNDTYDKSRYLILEKRKRKTDSPF